MDGAFPRELIERVVGSGNVAGVGRSRAFEARRVDSPGDTSRRWIVHFPSSGGESAQYLFVKQYSPASRFRQDVGNEFNGLRLAYDAFGSRGLFRVPRPYACDVDQQAIVMEYCPAVTLSRVLFHCVRWSALQYSAARREQCLLYAGRVGQLLRRFQSISRWAGEFSREDGLRRALSRYREHFLRSMSGCKVLGEADLARMHAYVCDRLQMPCDAPELVVQHADFGPWNVLLGEGCLYLVDFHNVDGGFAVYDVAYFHTALDLWGRFRSVDPEAIRAAQSAFLEGCLRESDTSHGGCSAANPGTGVGTIMTPLFQALSMIHMTYFASIVLARPFRARELMYLPGSRVRFLRQWFRSRWVETSSDV